MSRFHVNAEHLSSVQAGAREFQDLTGMNPALYDHYVLDACVEEDLDPLSCEIILVSNEIVKYPFV